MFGHRPDIYPDGQEIRSDQDRPNQKYGAKFVRTAGEPPPLFSGVLLWRRFGTRLHAHVLPISIRHFFFGVAVCDPPGQSERLIAL